MTGSTSIGTKAEPPSDPRPITRIHSGETQRNDPDPNGKRIITSLLRLGKHKRPLSVHDHSNKASLSIAAKWARV